MVFKELIETLKCVKKSEDLTFEIAEELVNAGITSMMSIEMQEDEDIEIVEAFDETRLLVMKMFDVILLDITMNKLQLDGINDLSDLSPMHDEVFRANIEKAIEDYNKRIKKN
jgi:hypothetical protein